MPLDPGTIHQFKQQALAIIEQAASPTPEDVDQDDMIRQIRALCGAVMASLPFPTTRAGMTGMPGPGAEARSHMHTVPLTSPSRGGPKAG